MRDRLLPLALALAALGLFWLLLFPKPAVRGERATTPLSSESAPAGYLALARWLQATRIPTVAWRSRFERLASPGAVLPGARGNLMVVSLPFALGLRLGEQAALDAWVRRGNTLLVMAALDDTPGWAAAAGTPFRKELSGITHLDFDVIAPDDGKPTEGKPTDRKDARRTDLAQVGKALELTLSRARVEVVPVPTSAGGHPIFAGVRRIATHSELPASRWRATAPDDIAVLELARRADTGDPAVWMRSLGTGAIIVSGYASPLSNELIGTGDNARWFASLVASQLGPGGRVVFDDAHQGGVDYYDPQMFFGDPRLHRTLGWIVLLWAVWVFGSRPLAPAAATGPRIDDTALLRVTADFYAGALSRPAAAERLCAHFFDGIRRRLALPEDGQPVWDWLARHGRVSPAELAELRRFHERARVGRSLDLQRLHALLHDLSGKIA